MKHSGYLNAPIVKNIRDLLTFVGTTDMMRCNWGVLEFLGIAELSAVEKSCWRI